VLSRGPGDAPERHRTLRATLDWSYELLEPAERDAFTALAAFAGGCELDAAEAVTEAPLPVLEDLVDKGLVTAHAGRLGLLEPIRQYADERLADRPDADAVRRRHFTYHLDLARRTEQANLIGGRLAPEFAQIQRERENFRVAIELAIDSGHPVDALALVGHLGATAWNSEPDAELAGLARRALAAAGADEVWIVTTLISVSSLLNFSGDFAQGRAVAQEAVERAHALGDDRLIGGALWQSAFGIGRAAEAAPLAREAAARLCKAGGVVFAASVLSTACMAALSEDEFELSTELGYEGLSWRWRRANRTDSRSCTATSVSPRCSADGRRPRATRSARSCSSPALMGSGSSTSRDCWAWPRSPPPTATTGARSSSTRRRGR
jgi:hypothetical protein